EATPHSPVLLKLKTRRLIVLPLEDESTSRSCTGRGGIVPYGEARRHLVPARGRRHRLIPSEDTRRCLVPTRGTRRRLFRRE
ncbi:hypothetical protein BHM03_00039930, partial [Ensete ventricosum]